MICNNLSISGDGHLLFAGQDTVSLAKRYGTPLYLVDEDRVRENCRTYKNAFKKYFGDNASPLYASKANCFVRLYSIMKEEDMGVDVVSLGEMYTAKTAGFDLKRAYFHSNNKTDADVSAAMDMGIGYFVADNIEEVKAIQREAFKRGIVQKILLRLSPGIDPHTFEEVATGKVDSKFGSPIETGAADEITAYTLKQSNIELSGFHCHVGSQVFGEDVFERALVIMLGFVRDMKNKYGYRTKELDLGGGFGVRYTDGDPVSDVTQKIGLIAGVFHKTCADLEIDEPFFHMEPGRSIVADAGMTLYEAGTVKRIEGYRNYVSVDGGMADSPRYALYKSKYTCITANKAAEPATFKASLVGRCCESGDIIQPDVLFPASIGRGDIIAVCTTGAYNYSMASNYNRIPRPATVMLKNGESYIAVKRESFEDLIKNEIL